MQPWQEELNLGKNNTSLFNLLQNIQYEI